MSFFKLVMIVLLKIYATTIYLKAIIDNFLWSVIRGGTGEPNFLVGVISNRRGKVKTFSLAGRGPNSLP